MLSSQRTRNTSNKYISIRKRAHAAHSADLFDTEKEHGANHPETAFGKWRKEREREGQRERENYEKVPNAF